MVGDEGVEAFIPSAKGRIIPHTELVARIRGAQKTARRREAAVWSLWLIAASIVGFACGIGFGRLLLR